MSCNIEQHAIADGLLTTVADSGDLWDMLCHQHMFARNVGAVLFQTTFPDPCHQHDNPFKRISLLSTNIYTSWLQHNECCGKAPLNGKVPLGC